jgi:hypothetical protein
MIRKNVVYENNPKNKKVLYFEFKKFLPSLHYLPIHTLLNIANLYIYTKYNAILDIENEYTQNNTYYYSNSYFAFLPTYTSQIGYPITK